MTEERCDECGGMLVSNGSEMICTKCGEQDSDDTQVMHG